MIEKKTWSSTPPPKSGGKVVGVRLDYDDYMMLKRLSRALGRHTISDTLRDLIRSRTTEIWGKK